MSSVVQRVRLPTVLVLNFLLQYDGEAYGYAIVQDTGLANGSVYDILARLRKGGLLKRRLEKDRESHTGPARYYYSLTKKGRIEAEKTVETWYLLD